MRLTPISFYSPSSLTIGSIFPPECPFGFRPVNVHSAGFDFVVGIDGGHPGVAVDHPNVNGPFDSLLPPFSITPAPARGFSAFIADFFCDLTEFRVDKFK